MFCMYSDYVLHTGNERDIRCCHETQKMRVSYSIEIFASQKQVFMWENENSIHVRCLRMERVGESA